MLFRSVTKLLFRSQKKADQRLVKQLLERKGSAISGNSHYTQANIGKFYDLHVDSSLTNGEPPARDATGRALGPSVVVPSIDLADWPEVADTAETATESPLTPDSPYVVTVGRQIGRAHV